VSFAASVPERKTEPRPVFVVIGSGPCMAPKRKTFV
jgi:hypothetical protein